MTIVELTVHQVQAKLAEGAITLIDVRETHEFAAEQIAGARCVPLSSFDPSSLPAPENVAIVFHCGIGKRSAMAVAKCIAAGIGHTTHMAGGLQAWKSAGLPTAKP
jgi:rhodanese-related sulfurtransferase